MTANQSKARRRWIWLGATLSVCATLSLIAFPLLAESTMLNTAALFSLACLMTLISGLGACLVIFNLR
jgi:hypothetical protein